MSFFKLTVLDIGHGNSTLIHSMDYAVVIDAAIGSYVQEVLQGNGIKDIRSIIVSHADADHIGGLISLLLDENIVVREVFVNTDSFKKSKVWQDFLIALADSKYRNGTRIVAAINSDSCSFDYDGFELDVLAPSAINCVTGPGTKGIDGSRIDANSMSVVLKLSHDGESIALISGDMDNQSLEHIRSGSKSAKAKVLIFPHHGGLPNGSNPHDFSKELCELVSPELIIFSNARNKHGNPRSEIIKGIGSSVVKPALACTQLSRDCCDDDSILSNEHLIALFPSRGREKRHSCAGTISIPLQGASTDVMSTLVNHQNYISRFESRKCKL